MHKRKPPDPDDDQARSIDTWPCSLRVGLTVISTSWRSAINKSISSLLKKTHMLRCAQSSRSNVLAIPFALFSRASPLEIFLSSLQTEFFSKLLVDLQNEMGLELLAFGQKLNTVANEIDQLFLLWE